MKLNKFAASTLTAASICSVSHAATIISDVADATVRGDNGAIQNDGTNPELIGGQTFGSAERSIVLPFLLPSLGAVVDPFLTASFSIELTGFTNIDSDDTENLDLYGIRAATTTAPTPIGSDFFLGAEDTDAQLIANNFVTPTTTPGVIDTGSSTALVSYLNE